MATAVLDDIVNGPEESRMTMQVDLAILGLVPFRVQYCDEASVSDSFCKTLALHLRRSLVYRSFSILRA
jgi:hypothetical protein